MRDRLPDSGLPALFSPFAGNPPQVIELLRDLNPSRAYTSIGMIRSDNLSISQVFELLAHNGYEVTDTQASVIRVRELETGVSFQAALEGNVLFMTVTLTTVSDSDITADVMRKMLAADNGISTSAFQLYPAPDGKTAITLNNFCTLQNMGPEDQDDILSLAGYLIADVVGARDLLMPAAAAQ